MSVHWHVRSVDPAFTDVDSQAFRTQLEVAEYAADELEDIAVGVHDDALSSFEAQRWEDSARCFVNSENYVVLAENFLNLANNADADPEGRAPLYRDEESCGPLWMAAFDHVVSTANVEGPPYFSIWPCELHECRPGAWVVEQTGDLIVPIQHGLFSAARWRDAWDCYATTLREWADASDEDHGDDGADRATVDSYLADSESFSRDTTCNVSVAANDGATYTFLLYFNAKQDPPLGE